MSLVLVLPRKETVLGIEELPVKKFSLECRGNWYWFVRSACIRDRLVGCVGVKLCTGNEERKGGPFAYELLSVTDLRHKMLSLRAANIWTLLGGNVKDCLSDSEKYPEYLTFREGMREHSSDLRRDSTLHFGPLSFFLVLSAISFHVYLNICA